MDEPRPRTALSPWYLAIAACLVVSATTAGLAVWAIYRVVNPATDTMSQQFAEYLPTVGPTDGILETATSSVPETFTKTDSKWLFDMIPLGTTVSEIRVPATYSYFIQLSDPWKLIARGQVCVVMAPPFYPSLPPAIDTDKMEKSTTAGWLRFNGDENLEILERDITLELNRRADDRIHRNYVRESCRQAVADFVKNWLMKENYWRSDRFHDIVVVFPDDPPPNSPTGANPPQISVENVPTPAL